MKNNVQLYINNQLVDLFDFEDINIVDSIQDFRDVSKVFVPFSKEFTVPASKNNNKIFKHYYNQKILNGFDARFKISAFIKINSQLYKTGKITLLGATLSNNVVSKYKIVFYDTTIDLKSILSDKLLSDLGGDYLDSFNLTDYNITKAKTGFMNGFDRVLDTGNYVLEESTNETPDIIIPFISTRNYYFFDSADGDAPIQGDSESRNIDINGLKDIRGLNWKDLRPSIKVDNVITAIENNFPEITFAGNFFTSNRKEYDKLYLWLNADKGLYGEELSLKVPLTDFTLNGGDEELLPIICKGETINVEGISYRVFLTTEVDDQNEEYSLIIRDTITNEDLFNGNLKGNSTTMVNLFALFNTREYNLEFEISSLNSSLLNMSVQVQKWEDSPNSKFLNKIGDSTYTYSPVSSENFIIAKNMPKMKIIDFLTGLFKMFNLTAYVNEANNIVIETLDEYYLNGNTVDVSRFIDTSEANVERNKLYSLIEFKFAEPKTFATISSNELRPDEFGNEKITNTNDDPLLRGLLAFDGGEYEVEAKFEKMQYERMTDQNDAIDFDDPFKLTRIAWGWCVNEEQSETTTAPILHYAEQTPTPVVDFSTILYDNLNGTYDNITKYFRPSNSLSTISVNGQSLHFGSEQDEYYTNLSSNEVSLFNVYWKNTILAIYDERSRVVSIKGKLPAYLINKIKLNDVLVIQDNKFRINKLEVNITTGDTKFELVTYREITPYQGLTVDTDSYTVDSGLITVDRII